MKLVQLTAFSMVYNKLDANVNIIERNYVEDGIDTSSRPTAELCGAATPSKLTAALIGVAANTIDSVATYGCATILVTEFFGTATPSKLTATLVRKWLVLARVIIALAKLLTVPIA